MSRLPPHTARRPSRYDTRLLGLLVSVLFTTACSAIHSDAVRELIALEGKKINDATAQMKAFRAATEERITSLTSARADVDQALKLQQAKEHEHALIFSSNQSWRAKTGGEAHDVAYMIGRVYLADHAGLDHKVRDQFDEDFLTLRALAAQLDTSWQSMQKLQAEVEAFARKSVLASVDAALVQAIAEQVPGGTDRLDASLKKARKVNDILEKALSAGVLGGGGETGPQVRSATQDLIDLLERVKR